MLQTGAAGRGIQELQAAVKLDEQIADGHFQLGRALIQAGRREEGKRELERARTLNEAKRTAEAERFKPKP